MFIHMFAFRWKPGVSESQKVRVRVEIRNLQGQIPGLLETWVGTNISPRSQGYELGGVMKFADEASLLAYPSHPVHVKLVNWLMPLIEPIEVDFSRSGARGFLRTSSGKERSVEDGHSTKAASGKHQRHQKSRRD